MGYTHGVFWSDDEIESAIKTVMSALRIKHMPTAAEIKSVYRDYGLSNAICRSGGYKLWAERLRLEQTKCETRLGDEYEEIAAGILAERGHDVEFTGSKAPYDLLVDSKIRVDVKASNPYILRGSRVHTFNLSKRLATCDIYMMFAIDEAGETERLLVVPWASMRNVVTVCIGENSKYNVFDGNFEVLDAYGSFYTSIKVG